MKIKFVKINSLRKTNPTLLGGALALLLVLAVTTAALTRIESIYVYNPYALLAWRLLFDLAALAAAAGAHRLAYTKFAPGNPRLASALLVPAAWTALHLCAPLVLRFELKEEINRIAALCTGPKKLNDLTYPQCFRVFHNRGPTTHYGLLPRDFQVRYFANLKDWDRRNGELSAEFKALSEEYQGKVRGTYAEAIEAYQNGKFEFVVRALDQVHGILPSGYRDSIEIRHLAAQITGRE